MKSFYVCHVNINIQGLLVERQAWLAFNVVIIIFFCNPFLAQGLWW